MIIVLGFNTKGYSSRCQRNAAEAENYVNKYHPNKRCTGRMIFLYLDASLAVAPGKELVGDMILGLALALLKKCWTARR